MNHIVKLAKRILKIMEQELSDLQKQKASIDEAIMEKDQVILKLKSYIESMEGL